MPLTFLLPPQAILFVVATVAMAAPQYTGAHSAWPLPYAGWAIEQNNLMQNLDSQTEMFEQKRWNHLLQMAGCPCSLAAALCWLARRSRLELLAAHPYLLCGTRPLVTALVLVCFSTALVALTWCLVDSFVRTQTHKLPEIHPIPLTSRAKFFQRTSLTIQSWYRCRVMANALSGGVKAAVAQQRWWVGWEGSGKKRDDRVRWIFNWLLAPWPDCLLLNFNWILLDFLNINSSLLCSLGKLCAGFKKVSFGWEISAMIISIRYHPCYLYYYHRYYIDIGRFTRITGSNSFT